MLNVAEEAYESSRTFLAQLVLASAAGSMSGMMKGRGLFIIPLIEPAAELQAETAGGARKNPR